jgi:hypothetical protein
MAPAPAPLARRSGLAGARIRSCRRPETCCQAAMTQRGQPIKALTAHRKERRLALR